MLLRHSNLDDLLNIDNPVLTNGKSDISQNLSKANSLDTEAPFMALELSIINGIVSSTIYDKRYDLNFEIVHFPFLDRNFPCSLSYCVYILQLIHVAKVWSNVNDVNNRNQVLTAKLQKQGYQYHKLYKTFYKCSRRHSELNIKYNVDLKTLLHQCM